MKFCESSPVGFVSTDMDGNITFANPAFGKLVGYTPAELKGMNSSVMVFSAGPGLVRTEMTELQANTPAGRKWIPSTKQAFDSGKARRPEEIALATTRLIRAARPEWSGRSYGPDTDFSAF